MDFTSYAVNGPIAIAGICYLFAAQLLQMGMPPFYRQGVAFFSLFNPLGNLTPEEVGRQFRILLPFIAIMMVALVLLVATRSPLFFGLSGLVGVAGGLVVRRDLRRVVGIPLHWVSSYWTLKWPMLLFDIWTISFAAFVTIPKVL